MTPNYQLPPISSVSTLPIADRAAILDALFEPSVPLHMLSVACLAEHVFASYDELVAAVGRLLARLLESTSASDTEWLDKILGAHPRLGEKKVDSALSRGEQAGLNQGSSEESEELRALNKDYEKAFPGLRYVVWVNGRSRPTIMEDMRARINRCDITLEREEAIKAMCDIASDRAQKLSPTVSDE
ncbi:MAG: hypothetical protein M1839_000349 [Geoglossum umbratile]|nr:MAG: hypothetical protein M1839_000349 [Geoglossum umbratile]